MPTSSICNTGSAQLSTSWDYPWAVFLKLTRQHVRVKSNLTQISQKSAKENMNECMHVSVHCQLQWTNGHEPCRNQDGNTTAFVWRWLRSLRCSSHVMFLSAASFHLFSGSRNVEAAHSMHIIIYSVSLFPLHFVAIVWTFPPQPSMVLCTSNTRTSMAWCIHWKLRHHLSYNNIMWILAELEVLPWQTQCTLRWLFMLSVCLGWISSSDSVHVLAETEHLLIPSCQATWESCFSQSLLCTSKLSGILSHKLSVQKLFLARKSQRDGLSLFFLFSVYCLVYSIIDIEKIEIKHNDSLQRALKVHKSPP